MVGEQSVKLDSLRLTQRRQKLLEDMGIGSVEELLRIYPARYELIEETPLETMKKGEPVIVEGTIIRPATVSRIRKGLSITRFRIMAQEQEFSVTLYNAPWKNTFTVGKAVTLFGTYGGNFSIQASRYNFTPLEKQKGLRPVYRLSRTMKARDMEAALKKALESPAAGIDPVPERYRRKYRLMDHRQAMEQIHFPSSKKSLIQALRTLKYEEFLCFQVMLQKRASNRMAKEPRRFDQSLVDDKVDSLPYSLTPDQRQALDDILEDMRKDEAMYRLVQGDVGCGKTVVAALALYACILAGKQAVLMAPTDILARQHARNLENMDLPVSLISGSLSEKERRQSLADLREGRTRIAVGTHALFQEGVEFEELGLVITDEQQRFGVRQRKALLSKADNPDVLMMTATPIPRTSAAFLYGDIDLSTIRTLPPGRKVPDTRFVSGKSMKPFLQEFLERIENGRQAYVVCASIEENPEMGMQAAQSVYEGMKKLLGKRMRIGLLHGKMNNEEKERIMKEFADHQLDCLVSTTVIEVGIDVPNADMMVIYDAHRFGLSTLHQLRGRIARGKRTGICWLLSPSRDPQAVDRLKKLEEIQDGFALSELDLKLRGPGDILGTRQSGLPDFILGDVQADAAIMEACIQDAREILKRMDDPEMISFIRRAEENGFYTD